MVDLMYIGAASDGSPVYFCANWCENGVTSIRGNFCPQCAWYDAFVSLERGLPTNEHWKVVFRSEVFDRVGLRLV